MEYPIENKPIKFITINGKVVVGKYTKEENMFLFGFKDPASFRYSSEIVHWEYIELKWEENIDKQDIVFE